MMLCAVVKAVLESIVHHAADVHQPQGFFNESTATATIRASLACKSAMGSEGGRERWRGAS